ncbi:MAG: phosphoribosylanthranilate isomerase [Parvularculaceae bacterium]
MSADTVKICGIKRVTDATAAVEAGASMIGFVFVAKSPRSIAPDDANEVVTEVKQYCYEKGFEAPKFTGLFVDAGEKLLAETAPFLNAFQFHGHEDAERLAEIRDDFGLEIIKAVAVGVVSDFEGLAPVAEASDLLIFDARPPKGSERNGGNGEAYDWSLLKHYCEETPFLIAGGLTVENVAAAIAAGNGHTAFAGVDVSTGVERAPGDKDADLISEFARRARAAMKV